MTNESPTKRIEYIDAMRGFTMFLVVLSHCVLFSFNKPDGNVYANIFSSFRMPLFFFVSGFVFFKTNYEWTMGNIKTFLLKKVNVQILSPLLFFLAYIFIKHFNFVDSLCNTYKMGYWFTFTLFQYFVLFLLLWGGVNKLKNDMYKWLLLFAFSLVLILIAHQRVIGILPCQRFVGFFGINHLGAFVYFTFGAFVKNYFGRFLYLLDNTNVLLWCISIFVGFNLFDKYTQIPGVMMMAAIIKAITGIVIVFSLFRKYSANLRVETKLGSMCQFVGRRTLDIYLLHYFFLPFQLNISVESTLVEFVLAIALAAVVVSACLITSCVLRLSPGLAHYLFGAKKVK